MKFALFLGCKIPYYVPQYESSMRAVLAELEVELIDVEFNCCGYPVRNLDARSFLVSSARNLALAEQRDLAILTPCKCCYGSLKKAEYLLKENKGLLDEINGILQEEGLRYTGAYGPRHLLSVLFHEVGMEAIRAKVSKPYNDLKIAVHYGCHALRPSKVVQFDDPLAPTLFDRLVEVTGAKSVEWPSKLQCCGNPLWGKNDGLSLDLMNRKIRDAREAGADYLCVACTYCQIQFDTVQGEGAASQTVEETMPSLLYPQLLGISMGIDKETLGISRNKLQGKEITTFLS